MPIASAACPGLQSGVAQDLNQRQLGPGAKRGQVTDLFGDVDVASLVDAQEIGDEIGGDDAEDSSVARTDNVDLLLGDEESARTEDGLELARLVALHAPREAVAPLGGASPGGEGKEITALAAHHQRVVDGQPRRRHGKPTWLARP